MWPGPALGLPSAGRTWGISGKWSPAPVQLPSRLPSRYCTPPLSAAGSPAQHATCLKPCLQDSNKRDMVRAPFTVLASPVLQIVIPRQAPAAMPQAIYPILRRLTSKCAQGHAERAMIQTERVRGYLGNERLHEDLSSDDHRCAPAPHHLPLNLRPCKDASHVNTALPSGVYAV